MAFPSAPKNKEFFSPNLQITYQYNEQENAWLKVNARDKYVENAEYSFAINRVGGNISKPNVGEGNSFEYSLNKLEYNFSNTDIFSVPGTSPYVFTLPYSIEAFSGVPESGSILVNEVYNEEAVSIVSSGNLNGGLRRSHASVGKANSALTFGGYDGSAIINTSEKFDGFSWTTSSNMNTDRRYLAGAGETNSAVSFGGFNAIFLGTTEIFDGASWSASSDLNTARSSLSGVGKTYAALSFGGTIGSESGVTEKFNGNIWTTSSATLNLARQSMSHAGQQNSALAFAGFAGSIQVKYEKFNGDSWSDEGNIPVAFSNAPSSGLQNDAWAIGGTSGQQALYYNGSVWSLTGSSPYIIGTSAEEARGAGSSSYGMFNGGTNFTSGETHIYYRPNSRRPIALFTNKTNKSEAPFDDSNISIDGSSLTITNASKVTNPSTSEIEVKYSKDDKIYKTLDISAKFKRVSEEEKFEIIYSPVEAISGTSGTTIDLVGNPFPEIEIMRGYYLYCYDAANLTNEGEEIRITGNPQVNSVDIIAPFPQPISVGDKFYIKKQSEVNIFEIKDEYDNRIRLDLNEYDDLYYLRSDVSGNLDRLSTNNAFDDNEEAVVNLNYIHQLDGDTNIDVELNDSQITNTFVDYDFGAINGFTGSEFILTDLSIARNGIRFNELQKEIVYEAIKPNYTYTIQEYGEIKVSGNSKKIIEIENNFSGTKTSSWTTTGDLNTARYYLAGAGTQNAALSFGGNNPSILAVTEKFNGSSWTTTGDLNTARNSLAGAGIQNAALSFGGVTGIGLAITEKFDGSSWSTQSGWDLNTAKRDLAGTGTQNAALSFGGIPASATTEKFDGSTWSTTGDLNTVRNSLAGAGTQNAALSFGGYSSGSSAITEKFDGSSWSTQSGWDLNIARDELAGAGTQNAALSFGGIPASATTEKFDGSSWITNGAWDLNTARSRLAGAGTQNAALSFGGYDGSNLAITEKFIEYGNIKNIVGSVASTINIPESETVLGWSTTGSLNTARRELAGTGIQNAALSFGGYVSSFSAVTEKFDGSTWAASGSLNTARRNLAGAGEQNAALSFGGTPAGAVTEKFDGSTWTTTGSLNIARRELAGAGEQNAALSFGGYDAGYLAVTEKFNGSTWTTTGSLNTGRSSLAGAGIQNAALSFGGTDGSASAVTEKFDGSTWVATGNLNAARSFLAGAGTQSAALSFGGTFGAVTEKFDGSTWTTTESLNTGRRYLAGAGIQNAALSFGGYDAGNSAVTEKFDIDFIPAQTVETVSFQEEIIEDKELYFVDPGAEFKLATNKESYTTLRTSTSNLVESSSAHAAVGNINSAIVFAGNRSTNDGLATEKWNGVNWSLLSAQLNTARLYSGSCGSETSAVAIGGLKSGSLFASTERFNGDNWATAESTSGVWSAGGSTGGSYDGIIAGRATSASGDNPTGATGTGTQIFNGITWGQVLGGDLNTGRANNTLVGNKNSALCIGGFNSTLTEFLDSVEFFDGSSWIVNSFLLQTRDQNSSVGNTNIAVTASGYNGSFLSTSERYIFGVWAADSDLLTTRVNGDAVGTSDKYMIIRGANAEIGIIPEQDDITVSF